MASSTRAAAVAGSWYPDEARALAAEVERHLSSAHPGSAVPASSPLAALVSPHAGLRYSGPVAALSYVLLRAAPPTTVEYAKKRTRDHVARFTYLYRALKQEVVLEEPIVKDFEFRDNIFPDIDYRVYR